MVVSVRNLGSGSSGNALLVDAGDTVVAIDCGVGPQALLAGLQASGRRAEQLDAVLLTHEHVDHVRSLPQVSRWGVPVVATSGTARATASVARSYEEIRRSRPMQVGSLEITAIDVSHDAAEPCGFHLRAAGVSVTILTDLGSANGDLVEYLGAADLIVIEANHDEAMLRSGPYPAHLKRRVLSATGHLSNADCGRLLAAALAGDQRARTIWLAHLSRTNNRPILARQTVERALAAHGVAQPVVPLLRHGHEQVWPSGEVAPVAVQMPLPLL